MIKINGLFWGALFFVAAAGQAQAQSADNNDTEISDRKSVV